LVFQTRFVESANEKTRSSESFARTGRALTICHWCAHGPAEPLANNNPKRCGTYTIAKARRPESNAGPGEAQSARQRRSPLLSHDRFYRTYPFHAGSSQVTILVPQAAANSNPSFGPNADQIFRRRFLRTPKITRADWRELSRSSTAGTVSARRCSLC
jgi:hypothetical protein